jgi:hypothetical protein
MNISFLDPRPLPSTRCQSLLGKAIQEHFTKPDQIASVFSSSPSLRNSSAGANFLSNFKIEKTSINLFETIFTPEDCFSLSFSPALHVESEWFHEETWAKIYSFLQTLVKKNQKYLESSVRSLAINSPNITEEQLQFILSNLKRVTKANFGLYRIPSSGISNSIGENLLDLEELRIGSSDGVDTSVVQLFSEKLKHLKKLCFSSCAHLNDESVKLISMISTITSLKLLFCGQISPDAFNHLAKMKNLHELSVSCSNQFNDENLKQICENLLLLKFLDIGSTGVTNDGMKFLKSLESLEYLNLSWNFPISDEALDEICFLKNLKEINISETSVTRAGIEKISVPGLKIVNES